MNLNEIKQLQDSNIQQLGVMMFWGMLFSAVIGTFLWPYAINSWMEFAGKEGTIVWWQGLLIGLVPVLGLLSIPVAVVTWILLMIL